MDIEWMITQYDHITKIVIERTMTLDIDDGKEYNGEKHANICHKPNFFFFMSHNMTHTQILAHSGKIPGRDLSARGCHAVVGLVR